MIAHETIGGGIEVEFWFQPVRDAAQQAESVERYVSLFSAVRISRLPAVVGKNKNGP
jgi:hypothetical protein